MSTNYFSKSILPEEINTIIYHDRCPDGSTAAFCAYSILGDSARYVPCLYDQSEAVFENAENKTLLFLDFSLRRKAFLKLKGLAKDVFILDHHLTAQAELQGLNNVYIDLDKCGSSLAWDFFNPGKPQPKFIEYVEDVDLWRWKVKDSYYFSLGFHRFLKNNHFDYKVISNVFSDQGVLNFISKGQRLYASFEKEIKKTCDQIKTIKIKYKGDDIRFGLIECENKTLLNDIAIFALANLNIDGLVLSYKYNDTQNKFSLRRLRDNHKFPMHKIAELFSGGGHAHAASFLSSKEPIEIFNSIVQNYRETL